MTDRREFRKEVREYVKDAKATCDVVRAAAHEYWLVCDDTGAPAAAVVLKAEVGNLARHLRILETLGLTINGKLMVEVRQAATGGEFEKHGRVRSDEDQGRMSDVAGATQDLISAMDTAFYARFRPAQRPRWVRYAPLLGLLFTSGDH